MKRNRTINLMQAIAALCLVLSIFAVWALHQVIDEKAFYIWIAGLCVVLAISQGKGFGQS